MTTYRKESVSVSIVSAGQKYLAPRPEIRRGIPSDQRSRALDSTTRGVDSRPPVPTSKGATANDFFLFVRRYDHHFDAEKRTQKALYRRRPLIARGFRLRSRRNRSPDAAAEEEGWCWEGLARVQRYSGHQRAPRRGREPEGSFSGPSDPGAPGGALPQRR